MRNETATADIGIFRSWWVPAAASCLFLAAVLGLPAMVMILDQDYQIYLMKNMILTGITQADALETYRRLTNVIAVLVPVLCGLMCACLTAALLGNPVKAMNALATGAKWMIWVVTAVGLCLGAVFVRQFVLYTMKCMGQDDGLYPFLAMVFSEALACTGAVFVFVKLRKFLDCLSDSGVCIAYTLSTGKVDYDGIPSFAAFGFLVLGIVCLVLIPDQLLTMTIGYDQITPYYKFLRAEHPVRWTTAFSLLCCFLGNLFLNLYLRKLKGTCEILLYNARKK